MSTTRSRSLRHRPSRTIPAILTALILLALGAAAVWVGIVALQGETQVIESAAAIPAGTPWNSPVGYAIAVGLLVVGLILLITALAPGKYNALLLNASSGDGSRARSTDPVEYVIGRRALGRLARTRAEHVDGVESATAKVSPRRIDVRVDTYLVDTTALQGKVQQTLEQAVADLDTVTRPRIGVSINTRRLD